VGCSLIANRAYWTAKIACSCSRKAMKSIPFVKRSTRAMLSRMSCSERQGSLKGKYRLGFDALADVVFE
jgi:hypothetical protein